MADTRVVSRSFGRSLSFLASSSASFVVRSRLARRTCSVLCIVRSFSAFLCVRSLTLLGPFFFASFLWIPVHPLACWLSMARAAAISFDPRLRSQVVLGGCDVRVRGLLSSFDRLWWVSDTIGIGCGWDREPSKSSIRRGGKGGEGEGGISQGCHAPIRTRRGGSGPSFPLS